MTQSFNESITQSLKPQVIRCVDCAELFTWTVNEQEHYAENDWQRPHRCRKCREKNREKKRNRPRAF